MRDKASDWRRRAGYQGWYLTYLSELLRWGFYSYFYLTFSLNLCGSKLGLWFLKYQDVDFTSMAARSLATLNSLINELYSTRSNQASKSDDAGVQDETGLEILWLICQNSPGCLCHPQTDMWEETQSETSWEHNTQNKPRHNETTLIDTSLNLAAGLPVVTSGNWLHRHLTASKVTISKHTMQNYFFFRRSQTVTAMGLHTNLRDLSH